ncbi:MAG: DUF402 domain-containing protein [Mycoplasmatales bacterium]
MKEINKVYAYKHDGSFHRLTNKVKLLKETKDYYIVLNNSGNYVQEAKGYHWKTKEKAIIYFSKNHWFNIMIMYKQNRIVYYCNLASPILYEHHSLKYIDYDLDIKYFVDTKDILVLDKNEYQFNQKKYQYSTQIKNKIEAEMKILKSWIKYEVGPFSEEFRKRYETIGV